MCVDEHPSEKMFKSRQKTAKSSSAQLKESELSTITGGNNKLSILAKLDNMLPGRHSKPSSESGSTSSLVSEAEFAKDQKTRSKLKYSILLKTEGHFLVYSSL